MARYLTLAVVVIALLVAVFWLREREPAVIDAAVPAADLSPHVETQTQQPSELDEIDVVPRRRLLATDLCPDSDDKSDEERLAEYELQREQMLRVLSASADADHLLVAALASWNRKPEDALQLLSRAEQADPRNTMVRSQILELCLEIDACIRARPEMERNLVAADPANGIAWVTVARSRLSRLDDAGALAALREAAAAAEINDHFTDHVLLFDRALAASSNLPPFERSAAAIGHAAAVFTSSFLITRDCNERAKNSAEWRDACLRLGERFEHSGRTILTQAVGMGLQAKMYQYGGDSRAQQAAERRNDRFKEQWTALASRTIRAEELRDPTVLRHYLDTFATAGEIAAMEYLAAEVDARLPGLPEAGDSSCVTP